ncbi:MAG: HEPN domain-containing protein [Spirochaetales bacterium]|jgi:HEPN domain-containing protein|nr:HEPN domain-containing protein [Spirochaetales bacterium]
MADDYKAWIKRAKSSLAISKIKSGEDIFYEDLCFQAQQAVEKAVKGLLIFCNVEPEKTHNLVSLIKELSKFMNIPEDVDEAAILNGYAVQTRYPGDYSPVEEEEYNNAILTAEKCVKWIEKKIKELLKRAEEEKKQPYLKDLE